MIAGRSLDLIEAELRNASEELAEVFQDIAWNYAARGDALLRIDINDDITDPQTETYKQATELQNTFTLLTMKETEYQAKVCRLTAELLQVRRFGGKKS